MPRPRLFVILPIALAPLLWVGWHHDRTVGSVADVAFSPDGTKLATVSHWWHADKSHTELRIWDLASGTEIRSERQVFTQPILTISADGSHLQLTHNASTPPKTLIDLFNWPNRLLLATTTWRTALTPDGKLLATARHKPDSEHDTRIHLWDTSTGQLLKSLDDGALVDMLALAPDARIIAGVRGRITAWDPRSACPIAWPQPPRVTFFAPLAFSPDSATLAIQAIGAKLQVLDTADGHLIAQFNRASSHGLAFSPDSRRLASSDYSLVTLYDLNSQTEITRFQGHSRPELVDHVQWAADQAIRAVTRGHNIPLLSHTANVVWSVAFSPTGQQVASCDADGTARVWDATTALERHRFDHQPDASIGPFAAATIWLALCTLLYLWPRRSSNPPADANPPA